MRANNLLRIRKRRSDNSLELRIMFLTALSVSLEGEADRHAILIQANEMTENDGELSGDCGTQSSHSGTAAYSELSKGLH